MQKRDEWFDSKAEAEAFCKGLYLGGRHDYFIRTEGKKWRVAYW